MSSETPYQGLKQEIRGLKDPGNALIIVYIFLIFCLFLFAGLVSAKADLAGTKEGAFFIEQKGEPIVPGLKTSPDHVHIVLKK